MKMVPARGWWHALAAALLLAVAVGGLLVPGTAHAQVVSTGSLSFSGNDFISQGRSWSYSTSKGDALEVTSSAGSTVTISVNAYNGDWWTLNFDAPGTPGRPVQGKPDVLAPGTYAGAHRYPLNGNGPGLDLGGDGRGCNELTGSFTITKAVFGPNGYVQAFDATFEQHCEGGTRAARGAVHISNPPPPPGSSPSPSAWSSPPPPHTTGSVSFSGDVADYISQGKFWSYSTGKGDALSVVTNTTGGMVRIFVNAYDGTSWSLTFYGPGGRVLAPGNYPGAHGSPGTWPGIDLSGDGRGCDGAGSFTITKAVFGPQGYVRAFDATFQHHCARQSGAARGEVHIVNPPPPPEAAASPRAGITTSPPLRPDQSSSAERSSVEATIRTTLVLAVVGVIAWVVLAAIGLVVGLIKPIGRR